MILKISFSFDVTKILKLGFVVSSIVYLSIFLVRVLPKSDGFCLWLLLSLLVLITFYD